MPSRGRDRTRHMVFLYASEEGCPDPRLFFALCLSEGPACARVCLCVCAVAGNPIYWFACTLFGCVSAVLSVAWLLHIILYLFIAPPPTIFLNAFFIELDKVFSLFGTLMYGLFSFYLLACVLKGCMKVGLRFFWIPIHPMKIGATLMNSFLFNVRPRAAACV